MSVGDYSGEGGAGVEGVCDPTEGQTTLRQQNSNIINATNNPYKKTLNPNPKTNLPNPFKHPPLKTISDLLPLNGQPQIPPTNPHPKIEKPIPKIIALRMLTAARDNPY